MGTTDHYQQANTTPDSVIFQQYWIRLCCRAFYHYYRCSTHTSISSDLPQERSNPYEFPTQFPTACSRLSISFPVSNTGYETNFNSHLGRSSSYLNNLIHSFASLKHFNKIIMSSKQNWKLKFLKKYFQNFLTQFDKFWRRLSSSRVGPSPTPQQTSFPTMKQSSVTEQPTPGSS